MEQEPFFLLKSPNIPIISGCPCSGEGGREFSLLRTFSKQEGPGSAAKWHRPQQIFCTEIKIGAEKPQFPAPRKDLEMLEPPRGREGCGKG